MWTRPPDRTRALDARHCNDAVRQAFTRSVQFVQPPLRPGRGARSWEYALGLTMASTILVLLSRRETTSWLLSAAECLATLIGGADIRALIVRPPPSRPPLLSVEIPMRQTAPATEAEERQRCASLRSAFTGWLHARPALDLSIQLDEVEALIDSAVIERGRQADIIVLSSQDRMAMCRNVSRSNALCWRRGDRSS